MKKSTETIISLAVMAALSVGNIAFVQSGLWQIGKGTMMDLSSLDAASYQVESVAQTGDGYVVTAFAQGFQSDVKVEVTFDAEGKVIQDISIVSQAETDGLGTRVTETDFTDQFKGIGAPVGLNGKEVAIASPTGSSGTGVEDSAESAEAVKTGKSDPEEWNSGDQSPEAVAVRALYSSDLLSSAWNDMPLTTATADLSPEEQAERRLAQAGLTASETGTEEAKEAAAVNETAAASVDAVSGATISSKAVVTAINNSYYFLAESGIR